MAINFRMPRLLAKWECEDGKSRAAQLGSSLARDMRGLLAETCDGVHEKLWPLAMAPSML